jgi:23S rRNA (uracil1939-C5)-methyltransferase
MVRTGFATGEMMVVLVTNGKRLPHRETLVAELRKALPRMKSLVQNINDRRTNVILGRENRLLWGEPVIRDRIGSVTYVISPQSFFQVNPIQTRVLYDQVRRYGRDGCLLRCRYHRFVSGRRRGVGVRGGIGAGGD